MDYDYQKLLILIRAIMFFHVLRCACVSNVIVINEGGKQQSKEPMSYCFHKLLFALIPQLVSTFTEIQLPSASHERRDWNVRNCS